MKQLLFILGAGALFLGVSKYLRTQKALIAQMKYRIAGFSLNKVNTQGASVHLRLLLQNPSNLTLDVRGVNLGLYYQNTMLTQIIKDSQVVIPANGFAYIDFDVNILYANAAGEVLALIQKLISRTPINIWLVGYVLVNTSGISHKVEVVKAVS